MKSFLQLDHPATWDEVCQAVSFSFNDAFELRKARDADHEWGPDSSDPICNLAEELAWLALASEAHDPNWN
jgi:hypothetical protein